MKRFFRASVVCAALFGTAILGGMACGGDGEDGAPRIPHSITSEADDFCRSCHETGVNGAPKSPHPGRSDCVGCHKPSA